MNKTPEQLAQEWSKSLVRDPDVDGIFLSWALACEWEVSGFLAGHKAASKEYEAQIKKLKANWTFCCEDKARLLQELAAKEDICRGTRQFISEWISVKDRLPKLDVQCFWVDAKSIALSALAAISIDDCEVWWERYTHWMPLPELPEEDKS